MALFRTAYKGSSFTFADPLKTITFLEGEYSTEDEAEIAELRKAQASSNGFIFEDLDDSRELTVDEKAVAKETITTAHQAAAIAAKLAAAKGIGAGTPSGPNKVAAEAGKTQE